MDYDDYELTDELTEKLNLLVTEEVKSKIKQTVEELESINHEYSLQSIELSVIRNEMRVLNANHEKQLKQSVKIAQREYWFDCAVGDKIFILDRKNRTKKCDRCGNKEKVKVVIDSVEVEAECPICGTYKKRQGMEYTEYGIIEGIVERLQIEITKEHKWVHLWIKDSEYKYEIAYYEIFKTKEECQVAYDEAIKKVNTNA